MKWRGALWGRKMVQHMEELPQSSFKGFHLPWWFITYMVYNILNEYWISCICKKCLRYKINSSDYSLIRNLCNHTAIVLYLLQPGVFLKENLSLEASTMLNLWLPSVHTENGFFRTCAKLFLVKLQNSFSDAESTCRAVQDTQCKQQVKYYSKFQGLASNSTDGVQPCVPNVS